MGKRKRNTPQTVASIEPVCDYEIYHIKVLDGIRAVAILIIAWYHIWQQSWLSPSCGMLSLDWLVRNGSILVDMMILLSGFCLFLPYARQMVYGGETDSAGRFYMKRIARIFPSYYLSILIVLFLFALPLGEYGGDLSFMTKDILTHLTFTHNLFSDVVRETHLNGVLWTIGVEVQLYLIFPLLARFFSKRPIITYIAMLLVGFFCIGWISSSFDTIDQGLSVNHTLTFIPVYANGMLGAWLYMLYTKKKKKRSLPEGVIATVAAIGAVAVFYKLCIHRLNSESETKWQVDYRYLLSLVFLIFMISTILSARWFRKIWDNRVMIFLAGISFNFYICHQYIAVKLKEYHIPDWQGQQLPNVTGDRAWQWEYTILCVVLSLVVAIAMTYLVERPMARYIKHKMEEKQCKKN